MSEHLIQIEEARANLLDCAAFVAENIKNRDGYAAAMKEIVPRYLEKGAVDLAAQLADSIDDPFARDRLLSAVAEKCAATGDDEYAFQLVEAIEDAGLQAEARERIAAVKAESGKIEQALEIAAALEHPSDALGAIAFQLTKQNRETEARQTLERIDYAAAKVHALQSIAGFYEQNNQKDKSNDALDEAAAAAEEIDFAEEKIRVLQNIAEHYANNGRHDKTIETFDKAKTETEKLDGIYRDVFLGNISLGFLRAGSVELADRTLDAVKDKTQIAACLLGFSRQFWAQNETGEAVETLEEAYAILKSQPETQIRDSRARFTLLASIAAQFAQFDKPERGIEIAQSIIDETEETSALAQIAQIGALKGSDQITRQAVNAIKEESERMFALINVSDAKNRAEKRAEAVEYLNEAAHLAETVPQLAARSQAFNELAKRFAEYGDAGKARAVSLENLETIAQIRDETTRAVSLARLAEVYEQANFDLTEAERKILQGMIKN